MPATPQVTANALKCIPSAAVGTNVTPNAVAWVNSLWVQLSASTPDAWTIVGLVVNPPVVVECEFDIGVGAALSEVVVATVAASELNSNGQSWHYLECRVPVEAIPAGSRVAVRMRKVGTNITAWPCKLIYYSSVASTVGTTANPTLVAPSAAVGVTVTPGGVTWGNSSWVELSAGLTDVAILGLVISAGATGELEFDVGIGAALSEVVIGTVACYRGTVNVGPPTLLPFCVPIVAAGTNRFAVRVRRNSTGVTAFTAKLLYVSTASFGNQDPQGTAAIANVAAPAAAWPTVAQNNTAWANSAWLELIASTATAIVITGVCKGQTGVNASEYEIDIGVGADGFEVVILTQADHSEAGNTCINTTVPLAIPVDNVPVSSRVAARIRKAAAGTSAIGFDVTYLPKPIAA